MGLLNFLFGNKKKKKTTSKSHETYTGKVEYKTNVYTNEEINPIYREKLDIGLLPGQIVLLDWIDGKSNDSSFPGYFEYQYGIEPARTVNTLLSSGYLRESTPIESVSSLRVPEIKEILKSKDLKVSGKKADLISRIEENFDSEEVKPFLKTSSFKITDFGNDVLKRYYYIVPAHKYSSQDGTYNVATVLQYMNSIGSDEKPSNDEIAWSLYTKAYAKYKKEGSYGLMRNTIFSMAEQLQKENKSEEAITFYFRVFILDLSGSSNSEYLAWPELLTIAPGLISRVQTILEKNNINAIDIYFDEAWNMSNKDVPFHYFDKNTVYEFLLEALENDNGDLSSINSSIFHKAKIIFDNIEPSSFERKYGLKYPNWKL
ncbi:SAP domain-containing protein [Allobacillus sp. SKP2-8]|uniref:SAP domain-containing protein n=1 Tax=unclassified Allobacillus TaxID=2628859 RepID=UPI001182C656|nr:SAP domain-containing protein [Allobacillus sp. SKP2-8]TSJ67362.1 SAP domain-containing protein [Allobacillus sp. SKP2-8]